MAKNKGPTKAELQRQLENQYYQQYGYIPSVKQPITAASACALMKKREADQVRKNNKAEIVRIINDVINSNGEVSYKLHTAKTYHFGEHLNFMVENPMLELVLKHQAALEKKGFKIEIKESADVTVGYHFGTISQQVTEKRFWRKLKIKTIEKQVADSIIGRRREVTVSACCGKEEKDEAKV